MGGREAIVEERGCAEPNVPPRATTDRISGLRSLMLATLRGPLLAGGFSRRRSGRVEIRQMLLRSWRLRICLALMAVSLFCQIPPAMVDYDRQVHPILAARCLSCHSQEKRSGGLSLGAYSDALNGGRSGAAVKPGNSGASLMVRRITGETQPRMPLGGQPLSATETATIRSWIDQGARSNPTAAPAQPKWEAPLALKRPPVPESVWNDWTEPLDRFVSAYLVKQGVAEPPPISDAAFIRRAYLDIWGLLPAPDELRTFVNDPNHQKRERLVDKLLADNQKYAENWISFWNDLLRNDEGVNYYSETASRKSITNWMLAALESNLPYDQVVSKLLNPSSSEDPDGFLIGVNWRGTVSASQTPAMQAAQNTAQIFLGLNLKCNSCHDSFISKWKLKDAYALATYFSADDKLQLYRCDLAQQEFAEAAFLFPELNRIPSSNSLAARRATAASIFTDPRNGRLSRTVVNRFWERLLGRGLVENSDEMDGEPWNAELLDWIALDFVEHGYDLKRLIATIVSSHAYQMPALARKGDQPREYVFHGPEIRRMTAEQFADAIGSITGDWHIYQPKATDVATSLPGAYTREWRVAASSLTRALGRPIRDQVISTRDSQATTLQALELVNGEVLTHWLLRGARRMLGELPPEPVSVLDKAITGRSALASFDIDVSKSTKLWLIVQDTGSYSPEKVEAVWANAELAGPSGAMPLDSLKPLDESGLRAAAGPIELNGSGSHGVRVKTPSRLVYDLTGKGLTRFRGTLGIENREITSDINPQIRFFVFEQEPNMERLTPVAAETPLPAGPALKTVPEAVDRVFWYALGRAPSADERRAAESAVEEPARPGRPSAEGLADLLWAVLMKPEFQMIY